MTDKVTQDDLVEKVDAAIRATWRPHAKDDLAIAAISTIQETHAIVPKADVLELCEDAITNANERWGQDERLSRQLKRDQSTALKVKAMIEANPR